MAILSLSASDDWLSERVVPIAISEIAIATMAAPISACLCLGAIRVVEVRFMAPLSSIPEKPLFGVDPLL
ncbi:MAG: hypothetical protein AAGC55_13595 [Myxococcota bacterium]